jgi:hypothetical protein
MGDGSTEVGQFLAAVWGLDRILFKKWLLRCLRTQTPSFRNAVQMYGISGAALLASAAAWLFCAGASGLLGVLLFGDKTPWGFISDLLLAVTGLILVISTIHIFQARRRRGALHA